MEDRAGSDVLPRLGAAPPRRIFIAVPSLSGRLHHRLAAWLSEMARAKNAEIMILAGCHPVAYARNRIRAKFLSTDCEALWMIDDDLSPPPDAWAMTATAGDLVSGATLAQITHPVTGRWGLCLSGFRATADGMLSSLVPEAGARPYPADACGFGSVIINRNVLENARLLVDAPPPEMPVRQLRHAAPRAVPAMFRTLSEANGAVLLGEDLDFTFRASRLGYSVSYDMRYMFGHHKTVNLADCVEMAVAYADS